MRVSSRKRWSASGSAAGPTIVIFSASSRAFARFLTLRTAAYPPAPIGSRIS